MTSPFVVERVLRDNEPWKFAGVAAAVGVLTGVFTMVLGRGLQSAPLD